MDQQNDTWIPFTRIWLNYFTDNINNFNTFRETNDLTSVLGITWTIRYKRI